MAKRKERKDASIVFAEIEAKLPKDLVLHEEHKEGRTYASNKYYTNYKPYWIKKETLLRKGKKIKVYPMENLLSMFIGCSGRRDGSVPTKGVFSAFTLDDFKITVKHESPVDDGVSVGPEPLSDGFELGYVPTRTDTIALAKAFTQYAGVTPTVYFRYLNYKQHTIFRKDEDTAFILKYCLEYSSGFCVDRRSHIYYRNRDFLLSVADKYPTLVPLVLRGCRQETLDAFLQKLINCGYSKNTLHRNKVLARVCNTNESELKLKLANKLPTTILEKLRVTDINQQYLSMMLSYIGCTKQKIIYKNLDTNYISNNYLNFIRDIIKLFDIKTIIEDNSGTGITLFPNSNSIMVSHTDKIVIDETVLSYLAVTHNWSKEVIIDHFTRIPFIYIWEHADNSFDIYTVIIRVELDL